MADGSSKVVYAALAGNLLVAISKFAAAAVSGSSAMFTEAIHSTTDCTNQILLLIGIRRGKLPRDPSHPFGYGMEIYFWTFVVAMLVLIGGGIYSIYCGILELGAPQPIRAPILNLVVLLVSAIFEGFSFTVGYKEYRKVVSAHQIPGQPANLIKFIKWSKDPGAYESLLEDGAALVGIGIAAAGTIANAYFGYLRADGEASLAIGTILLLNGTAILIATRSLIAGEAVAPTLMYDLWRGVRGHKWSDRVSVLDTLHLGPDCVLIAVTLLPGSDEISDRQLGHELEGLLKAIDPRILEVLFRFERGKAGANADGKPQ